MQTVVTLGDPVIPVSLPKITVKHSVAASRISSSTMVISKHDSVTSLENAKVPLVLSKSSETIEEIVINIIHYNYIIYLQHCLD